MLKNAQETLILQFPPSSPYSCANKGLEAIKQKHRKCILVPSNSVVEVCKKMYLFFLNLIQLIVFFKTATKFLWSIPRKETMI